MSIPEKLSRVLEPLHLGGWQYHPVLGSTNDHALTWAKAGAVDWSLVVADAQTAGRGRGEREWVTKPGAGLAMSLVVRPTGMEVAHFTRFTAVAALGLIKALKPYCLDAQIKWPNDILLEGKKAAGVLVEADWEGEVPQAVIIGLGVNISSEAVPPPDRLRYPATAVEEVLGNKIDRWALLAQILEGMQYYRSVLGEDIFLEDWNTNLAFRQQWVAFKPSAGDIKQMKVQGVTADGQLILVCEDGTIEQAAAGEIVMISH